MQLQWNNDRYLQAFFAGGEGLEPGLAQFIGYLGVPNYCRGHSSPRGYRQKSVPSLKIVVHFSKKWSKFSKSGPSFRESGPSFGKVAQVLGKWSTFYDKWTKFYEKWSKFVKSGHFLKKWSKFSKSGPSFLKVVQVLTWTELARWRAGPLLWPTTTSTAFSDLWASKWTQLIFTLNEFVEIVSATPARPAS